MMDSKYFQQPFPQTNLVRSIDIEETVSHFIIGRDGKSAKGDRSYRYKDNRSDVHVLAGVVIEAAPVCRARAIGYRQHNREAVGGFFSQIGNLYMVHHLWAYKDLQSREDTRNGAWQQEGWDEVVYYTVPLIQHMDSRIMIPTKASPLQ